MLKNGSNLSSRSGLVSAVTCLQLPCPKTFRKIKSEYFTCYESTIINSIVQHRYVHMSEYF